MIKRNKVLTYVLIFVVLIVWGIIIFRIVAAYGGSNDDAYTPPPAAKEVFNDYAIPKDTTRLMLNYRDPFGLIVKKDTVKPRSLGRPYLKTGITNLKPVFNWDIIQYSGYIRNPDSKKLIAFLHINGKEATMNEGETIDHIKLVRNMKDSVLVNHEGKTKYIRIKPAN